MPKNPQGGIKQQSVQGPAQGPPNTENVRKRQIPNTCQVEWTKARVDNVGRVLRKGFIKKEWQTQKIMVCWNRRARSCRGNSNGCVKMEPFFLLAFFSVFYRHFGPIGGQSMWWGQLWSCCFSSLVLEAFSVVLGQISPFVLFEPQNGPLYTPKTLRFKRKNGQQREKLL